MNVAGEQFKRLAVVCRLVEVAAFAAAAVMTANLGQ